jgi:hypothetical protein
MELTAVRQSPQDWPGVVAHFFSDPPLPSEIWAIGYTLCRNMLGSLRWREDDFLASSTPSALFPSAPIRRAVNRLPA